MPHVSVFIPVLNEAAILRANCRRLLDHLERGGHDFELIIGSNGSSDATPTLGAELAARDPRVRFFHLNQPGPGRAFARALDLAASPKLVTLDMDLSTDLDFVPRAIALLDRHDVVVGSKRQGTQERSLVRILGSGAYILCARLLLGLPYHDSSIGAKAFRMEFLRRFRSTVDWNTAYVGNLIYCAHRQGRSLIEVPVTCHDTRRSRFRLGHEGLYRFAWLGRLWWECRLLGRPPRADRGPESD